MPLPDPTHHVSTSSEYLLTTIAKSVASVVAIALVTYTFHRSLFAPSAGRSRVLGVIPARYASSRFPGKALALIMGKPMIQRTWEQAKKSKSLHSVVVATDDNRIRDCCEAFGAHVVMTSATCANGTERCTEALAILESEAGRGWGWGWRKRRRVFDAVINVQGDEPLIDPEIIDACVITLQHSPDAMCSTVVTPLAPEEAGDFNRVKCVVDRDGHALYFSRSLIPANKEGVPNSGYSYFRHLGLMCYDSNFLNLYAKMEPTPLQEEEDLEQLRILENGYKIKVVCVDHEAHGVDVPEDVMKMEKLLRSRARM